MLTDNLHRRIRQLQDRQEARKLEPDFSDALNRLHEDHYDLPDEQFHRWEEHLINRDTLALGAVLAMMDVRDARVHKSNAEDAQVA